MRKTVDTFRLAKTPCLAVTVLLAVACSHSDDMGRANVSVKALDSGNVFTMSVTVMGAGIPTPITLMLRNQNGQWGGLVEHIPAGANRTFVARGFDAGKQQVFSGSAASVVIVRNATAQVVINLQEDNPAPGFSNHAPVIDSLSVSSLVVSPGHVAYLGVSAHDPDPGDTLVTFWTATCGTLTGITSVNPLWTAPYTEQTWQIEVTVTDPHSAHTSAGLVITARIDPYGGV